MKPEKSDQTDEGYVEQRFEEPLFMRDWSDDRKAGNKKTSNYLTAFINNFNERICLSNIIMHTCFKNCKSSR
jgi:hypothetical protein